MSSVVIVKVLQPERNADRLNEYRRRKSLHAAKQWSPAPAYERRRQPERIGV